MSVNRVAAVDCGTNSIRLLVADVDPETGSFVDLDRLMTIVRLGQDVDRTGRLAPEALVRTFAACDEFAAIISSRGVQQTRFVATSASRDASNRDEFVAGVRARLGVDPEVVAGSEEAALSFTGAVRGLGPHSGTPPYVVVDIGGGSTEFVRGTATPDSAMSVDIGCVRMTERHLRDDPPTASQINLAVADIDAAIAAAAQSVNLDGAGSLVGVAGSVTTVAAIHLGLTSYDPSAIHGSRIPAEDVCRISDRMLAMTRAERALIPAMHPGRVDVIGAGALILQRVVERMGVAEVIVSETDILDGICWNLVGV
jgi:exopolyphosphatase / guanosine-5'-triphosphate,3'-diphosphate pyrophosphatase